MLRDRKIAVFIDVDNTEMAFEQYQSAMSQILAMGEIVCATVYGASERKQKGVIDDAKQKGYAIQLPARSRRRIRKVFDDRIWVDVTDLVAHNANVDTIAIVACPTDMVYLFSYLRRLGLQVVGTNTLDEASKALLSDVVTVEKSTQPTYARKSKPKAQPAANANVQPTEQAQAAPTVARTQPAAEADDLIGKIEEISKNNPADVDDDLVAEIKKLLDGLD